MTTTIKTPSHFAIATAQRNADKPEVFTIKQSKSVPHHWFHVGVKTEYMLRIDPINGAYSCECPFFCEYGCCKHIYRLVEEINIREREAQYDAMIEAGYEREEVEAGLTGDLQTAIWPRCSECDSLFDEAVCGVPLDLCDRCMRRALI